MRPVKRNEEDRDAGPASDRTCAVSRVSPSSTSPARCRCFPACPAHKVHLIWKRIEPVPSDSALVLTPTMTFADCPQLDVICVPGGIGTDDMVNDEECSPSCASRRKAQNTSPRCARARWCSARPDCWRAIARRRTGRDGESCAVRRDADQDPGLRRPQPRHRRRRHRRHRFRADAGVDLVDRTTAEAIQLRLEYDPAPPFNAGSPETAPPDVLAAIKERIGPSQPRRLRELSTRRRTAQRQRLIRQASTEKGRLVAQTAFPVSR